MTGDDPIGRVAEIGADLLEQMLAQACAAAPRSGRCRADRRRRRRRCGRCQGCGIAAEIDRAVALVARLRRASARPRRRRNRRPASPAERRRRRRRWSRRRDRFGSAAGAVVAVGLAALEQRVLLDLGLDEIGELEVRQLQHLDRLLQLRRHHQRLGLAQFEPLRKTDSVHEHAPFGAAYRLNLSPR